LVKNTDPDIRFSENPDQQDPDEIGTGGNGITTMGKDYDFSEPKAALWVQYPRYLASRIQLSSILTCFSEKL
jgi:hypothetical protein